MTRRFDGRVFCPHCRRWHTAETAFERWMRGQEQLDSSLGIVRFDLDVLVHRYMTHTDKRGCRDLQLLMGIEVKTHGGELRLTQQDSFSMLSQVMRNRKKNVHRDKRGRHAKDRNPPCKVWSHILRRDVALRLYGMHLLELSGDDPDDSVSIAWDKKPIKRQDLIDVLRFDIDPDTLDLPDWRRRYSAFSEPTLFATAVAS